jgi:hypothetical protein
VETDTEVDDVGVPLEARLRGEGGGAVGMGAGDADTEMDGFDVAVVRLRMFDREKDWPRSSQVWGRSPLWTALMWMLRLCDWAKDALQWAQG